MGRRSGHPSWNQEGYGCKGGASPTKGKKATTYEVELPDGSKARKRSMTIDQPTAIAMVYEHQGTWYISGIVGEPKDWPGQQLVEARRV